jgi:integrase/recombinase XerD
MKPIKASVAQRTNGQWVVNVRWEDGRRRTLNARSKQQAYIRAAEALEGEEEHKEPTSKIFTLKDALELAKTKRWAGTVGERSSVMYAEEIAEFFGLYTPVNEVTASDVEKFIEKCQRKSNRPATINNKISKLKVMRDMAVRFGGVLSLPPLQKGMKVQNIKDRIWYPEERKAVRDVLLRRNKKKEADALEFLLEVGCRFSELKRLKGKDINLRKGLVCFWKAAKDNKEGNRVVPLTPTAIEAVRPYMPSLPHSTIWNMDRMHMYHQVKEALDTCGIEMERPLHAARHTVGTTLGNNGCTTLEIKAWLGHSTTQTCERYIHMNTEKLNKCLEVLSSVPN